MKNLIERIEARLDDWGAKLEEKNIEYPVDLICGILFLVIGIVLLLIMPQQVQISEKDVVNGRAFPTMLIWLMLAMSALLVGREAYNMVMHRPAKTKMLNLLVEVKALVIVLILVVTYLLAEVTDLFVVGAVFCALAFLLFFRCKKPLYYAITVSMAVLIWGVFHFVLNVSFLGGRIWVCLILSARPPGCSSPSKISSGSTSVSLSAACSQPSRA